ncbi:unnamed protein product [Discula destructiva]
MAHPSPLTAEEDQIQDDAQQPQHAAAAASSQEAEPSEGPLRNAPTFNGKGYGGGEARDTPAAAKAAPSPGFVDKIMQKLGLNNIILMSIFKASVAPVIAIAIYQALPVRSLLTTLGYLSGIISVLGLVVLPRGKFIQNMVLNVLCACVGSAMAMLIAWSGVQARLNTSDLAEMAQYIAENGRAPYNSSQSAVCGVWLFFNIWLANVVRAKYPAFNLPMIIYSIFVNISATFGPEFPTVARAEAFIRQLILGIFIGLGIATGCSLFIFPISTRQIVVKQMTGVLGLFKKSIALEKDYLQGLERDDMFSLEPTETSAGHPEAKDSKDSKAPKLTQEQKTAMALRGTFNTSRELMGKIYGDIKFAKRDVAYGYLSAKDFGELFNMLRNIAVPLTGIGVVMDIFQKVGHDRGWDGSGPGSDARETGEGAFPEFHDKQESLKIWNDIMKQLHEPFEVLSEALVQGIDHAGMLLKFFPQPKEQKKESASKSAGNDPDVEATGDDLRPGQLGFSKVVNKKIDVFNARKSEILHLWAKEKGLSSDGRPEHWDKEQTRLFEKRRNDQAQLFVILYLEKLMQATGEAVRDFVAFAEEKTRDGSIAKKHFIVPDGRRLRKWFLSVFGEDSTAEESPDVMERGGNVVLVGQGWKRKDPEHLPATNLWQKLGNGLRNFSNFFGSAESVFGIRVALATMTVGILAFLEQTQQFFIQQRLVWAMIIIAIGMTQTSGQSIFGFFCRTGGTAIAMVNCFIIWYIVDRHISGVLVFLWLFTFVEFYFFFAYPRFIPGIMIMIVTQVLIIGYELQVDSLGVTAATASGQPYYPLYELAPYRLATVAAGCFIAFFWTIFPSPSTDRTWLRKDLSATLYLLANYSSVIHTTMRSGLTQELGDRTVKGSPAHSLLKVRRKLFGKLTLLLPSLQAHANFLKFEPDMGGKFPTEQYQDAIRRATRITNYFTLMSYVLSSSPPSKEESATDKAWKRVLDEAMHGVSPVQAQILSILTLLSNCLLSGQSLPPYLPLPRPYELMRHLLCLNTQFRPGNDPSSQSTLSGSSFPFNKSPSHSTLRSDGQRAAAASGEFNDVPEPEAWNLLDARHMEQRGYTEFAVLQVCSMLIIGELRGLIETVAELVGTVDFSFRVNNGNASDTSLESMRRVGTWATRATTRLENQHRNEEAPPGKDKHS